MSENEPMIQFRCSRCTGTVCVPASEAGKSVYCPACYQKLTVPAESQPDRRDVDPSLLYAVDDAPRDTREMTDSFGYFDYPCPLCRAEIAVKTADVGKKIECPDCGTIIEVTSAWFDEKKREREEFRLGTGRAAPSSSDDVVYQIDPKTEKSSRDLLSGIASIEGGKKASSDGSAANTSPCDYSDLVPVFCSLCGTLMYAKKSEIGRKIKCPDCETETLIKESENDPGRLNPPIEPTFTGGYELASDSAIPTRPVSDVIEPVFTGGYNLAQSPEDLKEPPFPNPILGEKKPLPAEVREMFSQDKTLRGLKDLENRMKTEESASSSDKSLPPVLPNILPRIEPPSHADSHFSKLPKIDVNGKKKTVRKEKKDASRKDSQQFHPDDPQMPESKVVDGRVVYVRRTLPKNPMGIGLFAPIMDAGFWAHWMIPGVLGFLTYAEFDVFIRELITQRSLVNPFLAVPGLMTFCMLLFVWLMSIGHLFFATFFSLAGGNPRLDSGFEPDFTGGFFLSLKLLTILTAALIPEILLLKLGSALLGKEEIDRLLTHFPFVIWGISLCPFVLFPFFFLSTFQLDYPIALFSSAIFRTLKSCRDAWLRFFAWTFFIILPAALLIAFLPAGIIQFIVAGVALTVVPALYAVVLGRLGWIIEDANNE